MRHLNFTSSRFPAAALSSAVLLSTNPLGVRSIRLSAYFSSAGAPVSSMRGNRRMPRCSPWLEGNAARAIPATATASHCRPLDWWIVISTTSGCAEGSTGALSCISGFSLFAVSHATKPEIEGSRPCGSSSRYVWASDMNAGAHDGEKCSGACWRAIDCPTALSISKVRARAAQVMISLIGWLICPETKQMISETCSILRRPSALNAPRADLPSSLRHLR